MKRSDIIRIFALLLTFLMVLPVIACGQNVSGDDEDSQTEAVTTGGEQTGEETAPELKLPETDFKGRDFTMLCREARVTDFFVAEQSGESLNDAVYGRNARVEDAYKVKIQVVTCPDGGSSEKGVEFNKRLDASSQSGCGDYDVVAPDYYWGCETKGYFANLLDLPYFSFDSDWWWKSWNNCFTINGKLTSAVGWLTLDIVKGMEVVYFNKPIQTNLNLESPYQCVYDKTWTIDKMIEMSRQATYNVDGKGATNPTDYCYGTILHYMGAWSMLYGLGARISEYDQEGNVSLRLSTQKNEDVVSTLRAWINGGDSNVFYAGPGDYGHNLSSNENPVDTAKMFVSDHALFYCYGIKAAELLASMDAQFGIVPPPKANADQTDYVTTTFGTSYFAIERGLSQENQEFSAFMLEALNYYSYKMVKDVYYENNLKLRYSSDPDASTMLDFVVKSTYIDFAHVTDNYTGGLRTGLLQCVTDGIALTTKAKILGVIAEKKLPEYIEGYLK